MPTPNEALELRSFHSLRSRPSSAEEVVKVEYSKGSKHRIETMSVITRRQVGNHFLSALLGFAMVWAFHLEYVPESANNPYWLGGGILVSSALTLLQYCTQLGMGISAVFENSMAITALVLIVGFVLMTTVIMVAELHFTPKWLSGIFGLARSNLVVVPLYLSN